MATRRTSTNGHDRLEEAMATLIQNQASFVAQMADSAQKHADLHHEFVQLRSQMAEIIRVLNEHGHILERLPDAVRERMGFRPGT